MLFFFSIPLPTVSSESTISQKTPPFSIDNRSIKVLCNFFFTIYLFFAVFARTTSTNFLNQLFHRQRLFSKCWRRNGERNKKYLWLSEWNIFLCRFTQSRQCDTRKIVYTNRVTMETHGIEHEELDCLLRCCAILTILWYGHWANTQNIIIIVTKQD